MIVTSFNITTPPGQNSYTTAGSSTFEVPQGVYEICAVAVGGGGGGVANSSSATGGNGGDLRWVNQVPVTPGETLTITVGAGGAALNGTTGNAGGESTIARGNTVILRAAGGAGGSGGTILRRPRPNKASSIIGHEYQNIGDSADLNYSVFFEGKQGQGALIANNAALAFGTGDFCVEYWVYVIGHSNYNCVWTTRPDNGSYADAIHNGFDYQGFTSTYINTTNPMGTSMPYLIPLRRWAHVAVCRRGQNGAIFIDGLQQATAAGYNAFNFTRTLMGIGNFPTALQEPHYGYISNFRAIKGSTHYDPTSPTITVPTSPLTPTSNTVLLTCQSNTLKDNSALNIPITSNGNVRNVKFGPFANNYCGMFTGRDGSMQATDTANDTWNATTREPETIFSGLQVDYHSVFSLSDSNFTIEFWFNADNNVSSTQTLIRKAPGMNISWPEYWFYLWGGHVLFGGSLNNTAQDVGGSTGADLGIYPLNQWNHVAVARSGNTYRGYLNGVKNWEQTISGSLYSSVYSLMVGFDYHDIANASNRVYEPVAARMCDIRIIKGEALYTGNSLTVPTTPLATTGNTIFHTLRPADTKFKDNSSYNHTIVNYGAFLIEQSPYYTRPYQHYGGGNGGAGGESVGTSTATGGGGAGGYTGPGGPGGSNTYISWTASYSGTGGGGGGGGLGAASSYGGGGGGVGILGRGADGASAAFASPGGGGGGGSGGANGTSGAGPNGGAYGGGGGGRDGGGAGNGGGGAVRIIWGPGRSFPSAAGNV